MKLSIKLLLYSLFLLGATGSFTAKGAEPFEWKKVEIPEDKSQRDDLEKKKEILKKEVTQEEDQHKEDADPDFELKKETVNYYEATINAFDKEQQYMHDKTPENEKAYEEAKTARNQLESRLEQQSQGGFNPSDGGKTPAKGPTFFEKIKSAIKSFVDIFTKKAIDSKSTPPQYEGYKKGVYFTIETVERQQKLEKEQTQIPPEFAIKRRTIDVSLVKKAANDPLNINLDLYLRGKISDMLDDVMQKHIEFAVANQNDPSAVEKNFNDTISSFDFDEIQKKQLKGFVDNQVQQIINNLKQQNLSKQVVDFFDNTSQDPKNRLDNFTKEVKDTRSQLKDAKALTTELENKINSLETTINSYTNYANYAFHSLDPIYRTRLLSFLEASHGYLAEIYSQMLDNFTGLSRQEQQEIAKKRDNSLALMNNMSKRLIDELETNQKKLQNTLKFKDESRKNSSAKPLSQEAQIAAASFSKLTPDFTQELINTGISPDATNYFNGTLIKNIDTFMAEAQKANASQETIHFAQAILDEIINLQYWLKEYATLTTLNSDQIKKVAEFITKLEAKSGQIRQLWAQNVINTLRSGPNNEPYILPQSIGAGATSPQSPIASIKDDLDKDTDEVSFQIPEESVTFSLKDYRGQLTGTSDASGGF